MTGRRQRPKPPAPPVPFEARLKDELRQRMAELRPLIAEVPRLEEALRLLKKL